MPVVTASRAPRAGCIRPVSLVLGTLACLAIGGVPAHPLAAQSVSPPIAEYQEHARSSFQLINSGIFPLNVVLEARGFRVSEQGEVEDAPLDTTRLHIKLSAMSFRIPPRSTYTVFYEASADSLPAWFNILSAMSAFEGWSIFGHGNRYMPARNRIPPSDLRPGHRPRVTRPTPSQPASVRYLGCHPAGAARMGPAFAHARPAGSPPTSD